MAILFPINSILKSNNFNKEVIVQGWVKTFRSNRFINLNDGSCIEDLQCVLDFENTEKNILDKINTGTSLKIQGKVQESQGSKQKYEIKVSGLEILVKVIQISSQFNQKNTRLNFLERMLI